MATRTAVSDEEIQLRKRARRRLVGAVALVVLVVAAVPMVLDGEPKPRTQEIEVQIPPIPANPDAPAAAPAAPSQPPAEANAPAAEPTPPPAAPPVQPAPAQAETAASTKPDVAVKVPPAARPAPSPQPQSAAAPKDAYVVQLIATSSPVKARELRQRLERQKFPVYTEKTPDGGKTRVRVGPFDTREAAEQARQRLTRLDYDPGKVVRRGD